MDTTLLIILGVVLVINIISFLVVVMDKASSRHGSARISEGALFFWAAFFGGVGIYLGMFSARHKTKKWYFYLGIPLIIVQNVAFLFLLYKFIEQLNF